VVGRDCVEESAPSPNNGVSTTNKNLSVRRADNGTKAKDYSSDLYASVAKMVGSGKLNARWLPDSVRNVCMDSASCQEKRTMYGMPMKSITRAMGQVNCNVHARNGCDSPLIALANLILYPSRFEHRKAVTGDRSSIFTSKPKFTIAKDLKKFDLPVRFPAKVLL